MASRFSLSTRVLIAAPALVLAGALAACSPPHQKPADPNHQYTLPSYQEPAPAAGHGGHAAGGATTTVTVTEVPGAEGTMPGVAQNGAVTQYHPGGMQNGMQHNQGGMAGVNPVTGVQ